MRVAFQGAFGAYSDLAAREALGASAQTVPCSSFDEVFQRVENAEIERGVVPIENSLAGTIHRNYDLLLRHNVTIVGEYVLPVDHCLIAAPGVSLADVRIVVSHPQALAQCEGRLRELGLTPEVGLDTAGSVQQLSVGIRRDAAGLASRLAAEVYGMEILVEHMQDHADNFTRFLLLREAQAPRELRRAHWPQEDEVLKTSVAFALPNQPGALFKALAVFALRDLDLTKLESRPIAGQTWQYMFYLDFISPAGSSAGSRALQHLEEISELLRVFGSYPRSDRAQAAG